MSYRNTDDNPICRFGQGDYTQDWPADGAVMPPIEVVKHVPVYYCNCPPHMSGLGLFMLMAFAFAVGVFAACVLLLWIGGMV